MLAGCSHFCPLSGQAEALGVELMPRFTWSTQPAPSKWPPALLLELCAGFLVHLFSFWSLGPNHDLKAACPLPPMPAETHYHPLSVQTAPPSPGSNCLSFRSILTSSCWACRGCADFSIPVAGEGECSWHSAWHTVGTQ